MGRGRTEPLGPGVLVIGCGFLGGHIARGLAQRGLFVSTLSRSFAPAVATGPAGPALIKGDAGTPAVLERALDGIGEVVYCIGGLQPAAAELDPERDGQLMLSPLRRLLRLLSDRRGVALTYLSSGGTVYGNPCRLPVSEDDRPRPIGAYAAVRLAGEDIVRRAHEQHGIPARILRCANVYGEDQPVDRGQGAVAVFLDRIARGRPIEVFGDGRVTRDYVYVGDVVEVIACLLGRDAGMTLLNVGSGRGTSLNELIGLLEAAVGRRAVTLTRPGRGFDVDRVVLDVTRMRRLVQLDPLTLSEGIARLVARREPRRGRAAIDNVAVAR